MGTFPMEKPVGARTQVSFAKPAQHGDDRRSGEQRGCYGGRRAIREIQGNLKLPRSGVGLRKAPLLVGEKGLVGPNRSQEPPGDKDREGPRRPAHISGDRALCRGAEVSRVSVRNQNE